MNRLPDHIDVVWALKMGRLAYEFLWIYENQDGSWFSPLPLCHDDQDY